MTTKLVRYRSIALQTVDFLTVWVDSTADGSAGVVLSTQPVALCFWQGDGSPGSGATWRGATWTGSVGNIRPCSLLFGPGTSHEFSLGAYEVWVRVTDSPTVPIIFAGRVVFH